jgi:secreted PhoX family phosphatase
VDRQSQQFLTMPKGAEYCGPVITQGRVLVALQHPRETSGATAENPGSAWSNGVGTLPRTSGSSPS